jgi:transcriptional regulator with XRE-family HTH domain
MTNGDRLRKARTHRGHSQASLGKLLGVTGVRVCQIEKGGSTTLSFWQKVAAVLRVPEKWLILGIGHDPTAGEPATPRSARDVA